MADNNLSNDEYEFADLDVISDDSMGDGSHSNPETPTRSKVSSQGRDIKRNSIIVIVVIIILMLVYKFMGPFFETIPKTSDATAVIETPAPVKQQVQVNPETIIQSPAPIAQVSQTPSADASLLNQKMATLDSNQQNMQSDVNNMNNQLGGINSNINDLNSKIANLNQMVTTLSSNLEQQSLQLSQLLAVREEQKRRAVKIVKRVTKPSLVYYIQAVIPGRAWLIATNGSTLTVSEGTKVAGYGVIKLIDPNQGRVVTSSGRVIKFGPQDT